MSFKKFTLAVLTAMLMLALFATPALAVPDPPDPEPGTYNFYTCLQDDWTSPHGTLWLPSGTYGWWTVDYDFWLYLLDNPNSPWFWPSEHMGRCGNASPATETEFTFGDPLDIWYGSCGMYFPQAPLTGTASLAPAANPEELNTLRGACSLVITDLNEADVSNPMGLYYYYYRLDQDLYQLWLDEALGMYVYDSASDSWNECSAYLIDLDLDNGNYGRLACIANYLGAFTIAEK